MGRGVIVTDASGDVVRVETQYGEKGSLNPELNARTLLPNATYVVTPNATDVADGIDFRHTFTTDGAGRVAEVRVDNLAFGDAPRSPSIQRDAGGQGVPFAEGFLAQHGIDAQSYDGGHLIANMFGGGAERINMFAQLRSVNQNYTDSYYRMEQLFRDALGEGKDVSMRVRLDYAIDTVPHGYRVEYMIDGVPVDRYFENI